MPKLMNIKTLFYTCDDKNVENNVKILRSIDYNMFSIVQVPIMKNGFKTKSSQFYIETKNACVFDSIFHFYATCFADLKKIKLKTDNSEFSKLIENLFKKTL